MENINGTITFKDRPLFQRAVFENGSKMRGHMEDFACFMYMVEGIFQPLDSHGIHQVSSKESLIKKCGHYIANFMISDREEKCEVVFIYLYPDVLHNLYKDEVPAFLDPDRKATAPKSIIANELIDKYINNLYIYFDNPEMIDDELAELKLKELMLLLLKSEQYKNVQNFLSELFSTQKLKFTTIIENHIFSEISVDELAYICGKSLSSFKREFMKIYEETPAKYIKNRRLEHAAQLLKSTDQPIASIAYESGFQDPTTFSAAFQAKFNTTASKFRLS
jgi:AraC-like DNA-binding protein